MGYAPVGFSQEGREFKAAAISALDGDADGWVIWLDRRPPVDVEIEVKREGEEGTHFIIPRKMSLDWNIEGISWRMPRAN